MEAPVKLCCGQRHWGIVCPDSKVMCCLCFDRFDQSQLARDEEGEKWDICWPCWVADQLALAKKEREARDHT